MIRQPLNLLENINQLCYVYNVLHGTSFCDKVYILLQL